MGRNLYNSGNSNCSIGCATLGSVFTIETTGNVTIPFNLTVIGNITNNQITTINNEITNISNQIFTLTTGYNLHSVSSTYGYYTQNASTMYYKLGTLNLPQGERHCELKINLCYG